MDQQPPRKRVKTNEDIYRLVDLKVNCDLSNNQLQRIVNVYHPKESVFVNKMIREEFRFQKKSKGVTYHRLHGCVTCDSFLWTHDENFPCDNCGDQGGRYDENGDPKEEVFYFPILPRLESMYLDPEWRKSIEYPDSRPRRDNPNSRSDVFDGTEYRRLRDGVGDCDHFITLGYCADGIPADKQMKRSILPGVLRFEQK